MGSGKSTVARILGAELGWPVIEVDDLIVKRAGVGTVGEIFSNSGEKVFRELEAEIIKEVAELDNVVISPGGGVVVDNMNVKALRSGAEAVFCFLDTSFATIKHRISESAINRPLFQDEAAALTRFQERLPKYREVADMTVATDGLTPGEVVAQIKHLLMDSLRSLIFF